MSPTVVTVVLLALIQAEKPSGDVKFFPPPEWGRTKMADGSIHLQPPGVPAGRQCAVVIMNDAQGEVDEVFEREWGQIARGGKVISGGKMTSATSSAGFETRSTTAVVDVNAAGRAYLHFFAIESGPRVRMVLYASNDKTEFDRHLPSVTEMLNAAGPTRPAVAKEVPAEPGEPAGPGAGLDGVYYTAKVAFNPGGAPGEQAMKVDYMCFAPDGTVYWGLPIGGPIEILKNEQQSPNFGRYTLDGDNLTITYNYDKFLNQRLTHQGKRIDKTTVDVNGVSYRRLADCNDMKLDGTFAWRWQGGESAIRFTKDGRFTERGVRNTVDDDERAYPDWPKLPEQGSGTYAIRRNTLELKYTGGPTRRIFFTTPDDPKDPRRIVINRYTHQRQ